MADTWSRTKSIRVTPELVLNRHQLLRLTCGGNRKDRCRDRRAFCNEESGFCQCYATYRAWNDTCVLDTKLKTDKRDEKKGKSRKS